MPKKDVLRRIDHRDPRVAVPVPEAGFRIKAETTWGISADAGKSLRYAREDHTHGTPDKPYEFAGGSGESGDGTAKVQIVGNLFGDLVLGTQSAAVTNLKAVGVTYNKLKATCEPVAPAGGIEVTVLGEALVIAEGAAASDVTTLEAPAVWDPGDDIVAAITALTGTYVGSICVMLADGS